MSPAVLCVVAVLLVTNLLNNVWLRRAYLVTCPVVAALLVLIGKLAGLSWTQLGMGRGSVVQGLLWAGGSIAVVALAYTVGLALPFVRSAAAGPAPTTHEALLVALVHVPFATVLLEEIGFRGVLWGLVARDHGPWPATLLTAGLFGLWHIAPSLEGTDVQPPAFLGSSRLGTGVWVAGTVVFTALGGVVFAELRRVSGSVFAPMGLHWATNGLGTLFQLAVR